MPSYQYTREIKPEDLEPQKPPELHGKEKAKNWWHYHWKLLVVILLLVALAGFFIYEVARNKTPDVALGVLTPATITDNLAAKIGEEISLQVEDINGDGQTLANVEIYTITFGDTNGDPYEQMAGITQLSGAFSDTTVMLFLVYEEMAGVYLSEYEGMLTPLPFADGAEYLRWSDVPGLTALDLTLEAYDTVINGQAVMDQFVIGVRNLEGTRYETNETAVARQQYALELLAQWYNG